MTLTRIQYFVEAARWENFTEAAKNLYVSQPNLSKQISLMEQEVGVKLFFRVGRTVRLTSAGRVLYELLKDIPDRTAKAFEQARSIGRGDGGSMSIGLLEGQEVNDSILLKLNRFFQDYPGLEFHLERNGFANLRNLLMNGHYDLIITLSFEAEAMEGVRYETIMPQEGAIAINRSNPLSELSELRLEQLREESFVVISPAESPSGYATFLEQCESHGFTPNVVKQLSSLESLLLCVEMGMGVALLDQNTRLEHNSNVRTVPIYSSSHPDVTVVWLEDNQSPLLQKLVCTIRE
ncbi:MAG: LysR family transcriptional regulator [Oscillospiraceae bacterium]|nr:LysR family transcriptional regulator [Oscillospiraceae bacterium]